MGGLKNLDENILAQRWEERISKLPEEIKNKLDFIDVSECQLKVIKRKRKYPDIGDIFKINPMENLFLYGIVVNSHINNINGEDLLLILIFKEGVDIHQAISKGVQKADLLIPPQIVGNEYWTRGYFYNVDHYEYEIALEDYGFYSIGKGKFFNEYGDEIAAEPKMLGTYGVCTIIGIAVKITQELIIAGRI